MNTEACNGITFELLFVDPMLDIIDKLENGQFRDCDISWLNSKLYQYTSLAAKVLDIEIGNEKIVEGGLLNDHLTSQFLGHFSTLVGFFRSMPE